MRTILIAFLSLSLGILNPSLARAQLMTLQEVAHPHGALAQRILDEMDRPEAKAKIAELGLPFNEARERIAALSDKEIRDMIGGPVQAGGDVYISLTLILLVVLIVLLLR